MASELNVGKIGVGTASAINYEVLIAGSSNPAIQICDTDSGVATTDGFVLQQAGVDSYVWNYETGNLFLGTSNTARLTIGSDGVAHFAGDVKVLTGDVIMGNARGVNFSAAASATAASNTLDYYEEGTWTPTLHKGASSAITSMHSATGGFYTRIGNLIWLSGYLYKTSGTESTTGTWNIQGLPFTLAGGSAGKYQAVPTHYNNMNGTDAFGATQAPARFQVNAPGDKLTLYGANVDTAWASGAIEISFSGVLMVA